jgi:multiple sugar transport system substrate-binding protein
MTRQPASEPRQRTATQEPSAQLNRRDFLGTASAAALAAATGLGASRRIRAQSRTEITFASAKFFGKKSIGDIVELYNQSQSKVHVTFEELPPPSSSTEVHQALVQRLARQSGTPDVFTQDIIWIAEFAQAGWALPLDEFVPKADLADYFEGVAAACVWDGKLTALPWFIDSGMLYYRTDLLEAAGAQVPTSWADLAAQAQALQESGRAQHGFLWQGKQAEVLVCDLVEFVTSAGGAILGPDGRTVHIAEEPAVRAVQFMYDTIEQLKISPSDVRSWDEEPSRRPFTSGQAAFLRNWSYVYKIAQDASESQVVGKVGVAPLPHFEGGSSAACLGGYQYGVNASSQNREAAIDFLTWMSSPETQLRFALDLGIAPSRASVFDSAELAADNPFMGSLKPVFLGATSRPVTPHYPQVSLALQSAVSRAIATGEVQTNLEQARDKIASIVQA